MAGYDQAPHEWPGFRWDDDLLARPLALVHQRQRRLDCLTRALGHEARAEAVRQSLTEEILTTSEIEGELLGRDQVVACLRPRLAIGVGATAEFDHSVDGVVEMTLDATQNFGVPLTLERLGGWHRSLFPAGRGGMCRVAIAAGGGDTIRVNKVVSGPIGDERDGFRRTSSARCGRRLEVFLDWFNSNDDVDPIARAAIAHFWFVALRPFDDGNGRIARAISAMALARSQQCGVCLYYMSAQIRAQRAAYYDVLQATLSGGRDITDWIGWFLACLDRALDTAESRLGCLSPSLPLPRA